MFKCKYCASTFPKKYNYTRHLNTNKHRNQVQKYALESCPIQTCETLRNPAKSCETLRNPASQNYECEYCRFIFNSSKNIINHQIKNCIKIPDNIKNKLIANHNKRKNTLHKLENIDITSKNSKIINIQNNIQQNIGNTTNNTIQLNKFGEESIAHIPTEKLNEILHGNKELMSLFCKELYKDENNKNMYIDTRKNLAFYLDKDNKISISRVNNCIYTFCNIYMKRMKQLIVDEPDKFERLNKLVFQDTYDMFYCTINETNIDDIENVEREHRELLSKFTDDVKIALLNSNKVSKDYLDTIKKDFYKIG